jgi:hypothetical protein
MGPAGAPVGQPGAKLPDVPSIQPARFQAPADANKPLTPAEMAGQKSSLSGSTPPAAPKPW